MLEYLTARELPSLKGIPFHQWCISLTVRHQYYSIHGTELRVIGHGQRRSYYFSHALLAIAVHTIYDKRKGPTGYIPWYLLLLDNEGDQYRVYVRPDGVTKVLDEKLVPLVRYFSSRE